MAKQLPIVTLGTTVVYDSSEEIRVYVEGGHDYGLVVLSSLACICFAPMSQFVNCTLLGVFYWMDVKLLNFFHIIL